MDAEFALSIGDIGMTAEETAYNAAVLPANRRIAEAVLSRDSEHARAVAAEVITSFEERITRYAKK
jgi:DNA-binding FadR family transcriptional regulator